MTSRPSGPFVPRPEARQARPAPAISARPGDAPGVSVRTLLCHRDVPLMLSCWQTVVACSADPFETVVHDDGSLTAQDEEAIRAALPRSRVLRRSEANAIMEERLARHDHARKFRAGSVWGLKLLDIALAEAGDCFYLDGDIRCFRRFRGLFCPDAAKGRSVFLRDTVWTAYSIRPWHLLDRRKLRVCEAINTGMTIIDRGCFDLDFVDWFLAQPDWRVIPAWTEPTCWAALAARTNGHAVDPRQFTNLYPGTETHADTLAVHLLSSFRGAYPELVARPPDLQAPPATVRFLPLRSLGPWRLGGNQIKRKFMNEMMRK